MKMDLIDHLVLTISNIEATTEFYRDVLGMEVIKFGEGRTTLKFGQQKLNLHLYKQEIEPKAAKPTLGSEDPCFITRTPLVEVISHLRNHKAEIEEGPIKRTGAIVKIYSLYIRDPDENLIEIANYLN